MTDTLENTLAHYGKKGMKWGVRNDVGYEGQTAKTKVIAKADKKYYKSFQGTSGFIKIHNEVAGQMNKRLDDMNKRFEGVDYNINNPKLPGTAAYLKAYEDTVQQSVEAAMKTFGTNASGTGRAKLTKVGSGQDAWYSAEWEDIKAKHAEGDEEDGPIRFRIIPKYKDGRIIGQEIELVESEAVHTKDFGVGDFLEHFGVKGMKWGQRSATIKTARASRSKFGDETAKAEQDFRAASKEGKAAAFKNLQAKEKAEWDNDRTAKTLKRGEQVAIALLAGIGGTPVLAGAILGAKAAVDRDNRKFKPFYDKKFERQNS